MRYQPDSVSAKSPWYWALLLIVVAWCTYLHVPLVSGGRLLVPSFPTVALIPLLFLTVRRSLSPSDVIFLLKIAFVLLLSIALSPGYVHIQEKFLTLIQLVMAIGTAVLIVRLMQQLRQTSLERTLLILWLLILVGSFLEMFDVIRAPSDAFRAWAYEELQGIYQSDLRDLNMVGWPRPKLFSEEPSHLTKFFIVSINAWLLVRVTLGKAMIVAAATVLMQVIMESPMLLVSAAITLSILIWNHDVRLGVRVMTVMTVMLIGAVVGTYFAADTYVDVVSRVSRIDDSSVAGMDESSVVSTDSLGGDERRAVLPWVTLAEVWRRWPFFGVGVGGKEVIADYRNTTEVATQLLVGNNAFASIGIFLGFVGGVLFVLLGLKQARQLRVRRVGLFAVVVFLFSQLIGGIDTFRYWGFIALLWGSLAVADGVVDADKQTANITT